MDDWQHDDSEDGDFHDYEWQDGGCMVGLDGCGGVYAQVDRHGMSLNHSNYMGYGQYGRSDETCFLHDSEICFRQDNEICYHRNIETDNEKERYVHIDSDPNESDSRKADMQELGMKGGWNLGNDGDQDGDQDDGWGGGHYCADDCCHNYTLRSSDRHRERHLDCQYTRTY